MSAKIGIVGLGVMGHNLALNMERNGFPVAGYDLDNAKTKAFLDGPAAGKEIIGVDSASALMAGAESRLSPQTSEGSILYYCLPRASQNGVAVGAHLVAACAAVLGM